MVEIVAPTWDGTEFGGMIARHNAFCAVDAFHRNIQFRLDQSVEALDAVQRRGHIRHRPEIRKKSKQTHNQSINQSIHQSINQSINQSVHQSINQSINQSIPLQSSIVRNFFFFERVSAIGNKSKNLLLYLFDSSRLRKRLVLSRNTLDSRWSRRTDSVGTLNGIRALASLRPCERDISSAAAAFTASRAFSTTFIRSSREISGSLGKTIWQKKPLRFETSNDRYTLDPHPANNEQLSDDNWRFQT